MRILNLTTANLRRSKGSAVSLVVLILIAAMLLNVGLGIFVKVGPFFLDKVEETKGPHAIVILHNDLYKPEYNEFLKDQPQVTEVETESMVYMGQASIQIGTSELGLATAFLNRDNPRQIAPFEPIEQIEVPSEQAIYVPLPLKSGGYELGDTLTVTYLNQEYRYTVAGYYESTSFGMVNAGALKFFLTDAGYKKLEEAIGELAGSSMLSIRMKDPEQSTGLLSDFKSQTDVQLSGANSFFKTNVIDFIGMSMSSTMMISIFAMLLAAFAWIIVIVALIVIRFRVVNSIEDQMINIGALGALGYTSRQITASMALLFMLLGVTGAVLGIGLSYAVSPWVDGLMSSLAGLHWDSGLHFGVDMISILTVLFLVLLVTLLASRRIKKLPPVIALRGGVNTHSFRKNHFPLGSSRGGLQFVLALKTIATNMRQNGIVAIIVAGVTFASVFSVITYYNMAVDKSALYNMTGTELSDVVVNAHPKSDASQLFSDLKNEVEVAKTTQLDMVILSLEGEDAVVQISDDFGQMENLSAYKGRMPRYDNEVVITGVLSDMLDKGIGDTLEIGQDGVVGKYLVTGLAQTMSNGGRIAFMMLSGMHQLDPDYEIQSLNLYLKDGYENVEPFIGKLKQDYDGRIAQVQNYRELGDAQMETYTGAITSLMMVVLIVTMIVVSLILYLVIHAMILKRKKDLGIYKALGYTAFQLKTQIALSFVPVVASGAVLGGVLGGLGTNPMLSMLLYSVGVSNAKLDVHLPTIILLCVAVTLYAYIISMWAARRIKKISAYSLIVE
ncbi:FtsX-like permease family protein [Paenibacillus sp. EC2-1]|uniref:ABC transporter permease n=1 Tax=Paenibacillus sp. EC2-1 TaxID=3388665 RepID=UPI003BEEB36C